MKHADLRQATIQKWLDLAPDRRLSERQAAVFATRTANRHAFGPESDPFELIMNWLDPYIPLRTGW